MHVLVAVDWHIIWLRIFHPGNVFARALWATVYISVISQAAGVALGLITALMRMSRFAPLRLISGIYVWVFRGTPLLVQIFYIYVTVNLPTLHFGIWTVPSEALTGIVALSLNEGAYMREIIRAGIDAVDKGQMEASKSLGMRSGLAMRRIILPQAARVIVPPLGNEFNNMMKNTSLLSIIGVYELFADAQQGYSASFKSEYYAAVAVWYLLLTTTWTFIQAWIERRLAKSEQGEELSFRERLALAWNPVGTFARLGRGQI
ncbi:MAG: amino acid ABC transporter permease [Gaiellaceae bacterium]